MFKHLWVERGMLSGLTKKTCILVIVIATEFHTGWAWCRIRLLEKLEKASAGGEVEMTGGYFYHPGRKFFPFRSN